MTPIFYARILDGKIEFENRLAFRQYVKTLKGSVEVIVRKLRFKRSDNQNRYYWGVVVPILGNSFGYDKDEMHEALKWKFLRIDAELPTVRSTTSLSTIEFEDFLERVRVWALTEYGIKIPLPGEVEVVEELQAE